MKKITLVVCFYILVTGLGFCNAQSTSIPEKRKLSFTEQTPQTSSVAKPAEESAYFGFDQKIAKITLNGSIPSNFPTRENYPTKTQYLNVINKWIKENPSYIKPEYRSTVITE